MGALYMKAPTRWYKSQSHGHNSKKHDTCVSRHLQIYLKSYVFRGKLDKSGETCQDRYVPSTLPNLFDKNFCNLFHDTRLVLIVIKISFSMTACGEVQSQVRAVTLTARATRSH